MGTGVGMSGVAAGGVGVVGAAQAVIINNPINPITTLCFVNMLFTFFRFALPVFKRLVK